MDVNQLFTIFKNHTHTGSHPDAKRLPPGLIRRMVSAGIGLLSPNNSRYILGIDNTGALTTTAVPYSCVLISPDGRTFAIGVDSDGVPTTAPVSNEYSFMTFSRSIILVDSLGTAWELGVDDDGAVTTAPA